MCQATLHLVFEISGQVCISNNKHVSGIELKKLFPVFYSSRQHCFYYEYIVFFIFWQLFTHFKLVICTQYLLLFYIFECFKFVLKIFIYKKERIYDCAWLSPFGNNFKLAPKTNSNTFCIVLNRLAECLSGSEWCAKTFVYRTAWTGSTQIQLEAAIWHKQPCGT